MITFRDGPATAGQGLMLRRAPIYLRVVIDADGTVDALDQPDDTPGPSETIHVYRRVGGVGRMHVCYRGKRWRESGWYVVAEYELVDVYGEQFRMTEAWQRWALAQPESFGA